METVWQDVRYAVRGLTRNPGFAITAILSLMLGVGASLAIFTVTDTVLLRPMPFRDPDRLAMVWETNSRRPQIDENVISPANFLDWQKQNDVFESMAPFVGFRTVLSDNGRAEELPVQAVGAEFFPMLGVQPLRGRFFTEAEDRASVSTDTLLLISYRVWQNWFGGDENVIGRHVQVNSTPRTIIGVLPTGFSVYDRDTDLWMPLGLDRGRDYRAKAGRYMMSLARLKPGVTRAEAQSHMAGIAKRLEVAYPKFDTNWSVNVEPLREAMVRQMKASLLILLGAAGLLLAVACANVANLLLARCAGRRIEMAVRTSLGAGRWRVVRQLLTESVILGLVGGLAGIALARGGVVALMALAPQALVRGLSVAIDVRVLLFATGLSVLTGLVFGLAPAVVTSRGLGVRSNIGGGSGVRNLLVAAEVALSVMLLAGAMLLFRSVVGLQAVRPGLEASNVLTFRVNLPAARYDVDRRKQAFGRIVDQLRELPGVRSAGAVSYLDFTGMVAGTDLRIEGHPTPKTGEEPGANVRTVFPGYFRTLGIPIESGRDFTDVDNDTKAPCRFIVNQAFVRSYMVGEQPLGRRISVDMGQENPFGEIIGVAGDVFDGALDKPARPTVYYIYSRLQYTAMTFVARTAGNPLGIAEAARQIVRGVDRELPVADMRTMEAIVGETFARQRFSAFLLSVFSLSSILLAAVGIYGVLAYSVTERTREIGVRVALGAEPGRIVGLIVGSGARVVVAGMVAGIAGALALSGLLRGLLFGIGPRDVASMVTAPVVLGVVALTAAYVPARRASRLDPMNALRAE